jgi:hypothetical protein
LRPDKSPANGALVLPGAAVDVLLKALLCIGALLGQRWRQG